MVLEAAGDKKINVIKEVRALTSLGLKEAKELVEAAPKPILEKVAKDAAEKAKEERDAASAEKAKADAAAKAEREAASTEKAKAAAAAKAEKEASAQKAAAEAAARSDLFNRQTALQQEIDRINFETSIQEAMANR